MMNYPMCKPRGESLYTAETSAQIPRLEPWTILRQRYTVPAGCIHAQLLWDQRHDLPPAFPSPAGSLRSPDGTGHRVAYPTRDRTGAPGSHARLAQSHNKMALLPVACGAKNAVTSSS